MLVSIFNSLEKKALEYKELQQQENTIKARREALKDEIINIVLSEGTLDPEKEGSAKMQAGKFKLSTRIINKLAPGKGSTDFLKDHAPDLLTPVSYADLRIS